MLSIIGWVLLILLIFALCTTSCYVFNDFTLKKYMLIIDKEVHYFEFYLDVITYVQLSDIVEYQIYVKDKGRYVFITDKVTD